ncbi:WD40 repeat domain-containing serine/threonine-protein kinase [Nonomuraea sediminis]|uniref:WD40 repeat domain-containing serine/threonine-protein kinase n=1 Tax=Nonomuraea sediminis TaxID=2835864 RepID=UPI001BDCE6B7|nr:WD40 repeat domain-containing serine/threonine-protein kinase [Nonomuraea sediminis]
MSAEPLRAGDPQRLGGYWLAGRLGSGGQGVVYEGYDEAANRVAVKVLHAYLPGDHQLRRRFVREVTAAQRVAAFCTARVLDHDLTGERPYIVSEFVPGPSMRRAVTEAVTGDGLHRLVVGMATALAAIHQAGVVHRDLKPENVLLGPDGPRVIDFGIARTVGLSMTSTGELVGTPMYMAPELFDGGRVEPAADVFAWGAMAYFVATGRDAFAAPTTVAVINRLLTASIDLSHIPEGLRELVAAALAKDPAERPTAQELLLHLLGARASLSDGARTAAAVRPPSELAGTPALGAVAENVYAALTADAREVARQVLLRLVDVHDTDESPRRAALGELPDPAAAEPVVAALEEAALIERGQDTLAVRQAALLRAWPRLHAWVSGDRDALRRHRRLGEAARRWLDGGRHAEDLLRGTALRDALAWAADVPSHLTLNPAERAFLEESRAQSARQRRRRRLVVTGLAGLLVVALTAGTLAWQQSLRGDASERDLAAERAQAAARNLALRADSLRKTDPERAMLLSAAAYRLAPVPEARAAVFSSLAQQEYRVLKDPAPANTTRTLTPDGRRLVSVGGGEVAVYDVMSGKRETSFRVGQVTPFGGAAVNGNTLALGLDEKVGLWDLRTGKPLGGGPLPGFDPPTELRFSPGGGYLTAKDGGEPRAALWSVATHRVLAKDATRYAVGPGDRFVMIDKKTVALPGLGSWTGLRLPDVADAFTADGRSAMAGGKLWDISAGKPAEIEVGKLIDLYQASFSADGAFLATVSGVYNTTVTLWRVRDGAQLLRFTLSARVNELPRFSRDNRLLTLLDETGQVTVYDTAGLTGTIPATPAGAGTAELTPDGTLAVTAVGNQVYTLAIPSLHEYGATIEVPGDDAINGALGVAVSPDGKTVVTSSDSTVGPLRFWDARSGRALGTVELPQLGVGGRPSFSPDGHFLVVTYVQDNDYFGHGAVVVFDAHTRKQVFKRENVSTSAIPVFSADSRYLTTGDPLGMTLIDLTTKRVTSRTTPNRWLALSPSGDLAAAPSGTRTVALWDTRTWQPTGRLFRVNGDVTAASISRDGSLLAVIYGAWVALFDLRTGAQLGTPWPTAIAHPTGYAAYIAETRTAFTPDGTHLRVIGPDGTYHDIPLNPSDALVGLCARAARSLTRDEWHQDAPDLPYQPACP